MKEKKVYAPFKVPDYRVIRPTMFLEKDGKTVASVQQLSSFTIGQSKLSFITPNSASMFLNKSWKEYEKGLAIYNEIIKPNLKPGKTYDVPLDDLPKLYDYIEHIQTSIITIYSAIEALSNLAIPNDFTLTKVNQKGVTETWNKVNIERWLTTEEKIGKIVPEILGIESPSKFPFWENFKNLKQIRDDIIHQKHSIGKPDDIESSFLQVLLNDTISSKIVAGFELIKYFCEKDQRHLYFPMLSSEVPVNVNIIDSFDGTFSFVNKQY